MHASTVCCPALSLARRDGTGSHHLWRSSSGKRGLHDIEADVEVLALYAFPWADQWAALEPPLRTHLQIMQLIVNNCPHCSIADIHLHHPHSQCDTPLTSHWVTDLVDEISRNNYVCLAWSRVINQTLTGCTKTRTPFSHELVGHGLPRIRSPASDERWTVPPSTVRNRIMPWCSSSVEFCNVNAITRSLCSLLRMLAPPHAPNHGGDSNRILRCIATFSHSGIGIYVDGYVVTTFRAF